MREIPQVKERPAGIPSTTVTNEQTRAINAMAPILMGGQVFPERVGGSSSEDPRLIPVLCTQDGGYAGDDSTECTFSYTITTLDGDDVSVHVALLGHRPLKVEMTAGTCGLAAKKSDGTWVLMTIDERFKQQTGCSA